MDELTRLNTDFAKRYPKEFATALREFSLEDTAGVLESLSGDVAARIAANLPMAILSPLATDGRLPARNLLESATLDDATSLLNRLPRERRLALVNEVQDPKKRRQLLRLLNYPPYSVGSLVSYASLRFGVDESVHVLAESLADGASADEPAILAVDGESNYAGVVDLWRIIPEIEHNRSIGHYITVVPPLRAEQSQVSARSHREWRARNWLPVVDHEQRIVGLCWRADLFVEQASGDGSGQAGSAPLKFAADYMRVMLELMTTVLSRGSSR